MKVAYVYRLIRRHPVLHEKTRTLQYRYFQPDIVPQDPKSKPVKYKYPDSYNPYGPKPPPSDKIVQLAERIVSLTSEERSEIGPALGQKMILPMLKHITVEGAALAPQGGGVGGTGSAKAEDKKAEKTTFDVKLEKFDAGAKLKIIKEIRSFTDLGLKEAKDLVEKAPVVLKQQITKDEANSIIEKIKAVGGVAVIE